MTTTAPGHTGMFADISLDMYALYGIERKKCNQSMEFSAPTPLHTQRLRGMEQ